MEPTVYSLYGMEFESTMPLDVPKSGGAPLFRVDRAALDPLPDGAAVPSYRFDENGAHFRFESDIELGISRSQVTVAAPPDESGTMRASIYLLGPIMSYLLELRGVVVLHASCVEIEGEAVAFLSASGGGKTNLAVAGLCAGRRLVADDIAAVDAEEAGVWVRPARPSMRLWPGDIPAHWGLPDEFPIVHPNFDKRRIPLAQRAGFCSSPVPLSCLYVPVRSSTVTTYTFEDLAPADALVELVRQSFCLDFVDVVELQPDRLFRLAQIVRSVPVRRMTYPDGRQHLPSVWEAVEANLRETVV